MGTEHKSSPSPFHEVKRKSQLSGVFGAPFHPIAKHGSANSADNHPTNVIRETPDNHRNDANP